MFNQFSNWVFWLHFNQMPILISINKMFTLRFSTRHPFKYWDIILKFSFYFPVITRSPHNTGYFDLISVISHNLYLSYNSYPLVMKPLQISGLIFKFTFSLQVFFIIIRTQTKVVSIDIFTLKISTRHSFKNCDLILNF